MAREGLVDIKQKEHIQKRAAELMQRYLRHPISQQVAQAEEKHHELPYSYTAKGRTENGIIDLLYRDENGWTVLDFKTNYIDTPELKADLRERYSRQINRYAIMVQTQMKTPVRKFLCFLDDLGGISIEELQ